MLWKPLIRFGLLYSKSSRRCQHAKPVPAQSGKNSRQIIEYTNYSMLRREQGRLTVLERIRGLHLGAQLSQNLHQILGGPRYPFSFSHVNI